MSRPPNPAEQYLNAEIEWYRKHGKYPERIASVGGGPFMVGDWSWNRRHPDKEEYVEHLIDAALSSPTGQ